MRCILTPLTHQQGSLYRDIDNNCFSFYRYYRTMTKFHSRFPCLAIRVGRGIIVTAASRSTSRLVWLFLCTVLLLTKKNVGHSYNLLVKYYYSTTTARSTVAGCGWRCPTDFQGSKPVWMPTTTMMMLMRQDEITIHPSLMGSLSNMAQNPTNRSRTVTSNTMSNTNNRMLMAVAATSYSSSSSNTTAKVDSRRKVMTMTLTTNEISPYYRRDRNDPFRFGEDGDADICDRSGLAKLLRERWQVRCSPLLRSSSLPSRGFSRTDKDQSGSSNSSTILGEKTASSITQRHLRTRRAQLDRRLLEEFGVRVYDHPPIWTRDDHLPAAQWRRQQWYRQRRRQQQHQKNHRRNNSTFYSIPVGPAGHPFQYVGPTRNGASSVTTSVSCSLSLPQIHNHIQYYWQYRSTENHPMAEAIRFELSLFGINIDDERMEWMITDPISGLLIVPPVEFLTNSWPEYRQRNHVTSLESDNRDHSGPMRHQQEPDTERPKEQSSAARRHRRGKGRACDDSNIAGETVFDNSSSTSGYCNCWNKGLRPWHVVRHAVPTFYRWNCLERTPYLSTIQHKLGGFNHHILYPIQQSSIVY